MNNQEKLIKEAETAAEQASEITEKTEDPRAAQSTQPAQPEQLVVPDSVVVPTKKKHTVRNIILIIVGVLLVGCIGLLIWFFAYYNQPSKVVGDAITNAYQAQNISASGTVTYNGENGEISTTDFNLLANRNLPLSFQANININDGGERHKLSARLDLDTKGVIYAQVDGVSDAIGITDEIRGASSYADENLAIAIDFIDNLESETWAINVPEITSELELDSQLKSSIDGTYACLIDSAKDATASDAGTLANLYQSYPFLNISDRTTTSGTFGHNVYRVSLDSHNLYKFVNQLSDTSYFNNFKKCATRAGLTVSGEAISEEGIESIVGEVPALELQIDWFSHQLEQIKTVSSGDDATTFELKLSFPEKVNIQMPEEYLSATEILDQFTDVVSIYLYGGMFSAEALEL